MILSPIEQFTLYNIIKFSNLSLYLILVFFSIYLFSFLNTFIIQKHIEWWYRNLKNIEDKVFILLSIWLIILISNVIGMIPYSYTITAQAIIVFSIAIPTFISLNILGITYHGKNIFYLILPAGAPIFLTPAIAILELISYLIRPLSLTLRLSANMIAGHILMKILLYALISTPLLSIILLPIILLELLVAFLQAYVFVVLITSYYQDIILPH